jgi:REP element-mobilizing transposase RayT
MKALVLEKQTTYGYEVLEQEVMPDHVHLLPVIPPLLSVVQVVNKNQRLDFVYASERVLASALSSVALESVEVHFVLKS